ncbi:MAG: hypothetical protein ACRDZ4_15070 [Egibacteraceae bacterium]
MSLLRGMVIVLGATLVACSSSSSQQENVMTAKEALSQVKELVDATLDEVASNAERTPEAVPGGTTCESSLGGPTGKRSYGYIFSFPVPDEATGKQVLREAAKLWRQKAHQVTGDLDDEYSPFIRTGEDGFNFMVTFARQTLRASVGGSTPCVDPLPGDV